TTRELRLGWQRDCQAGACDDGFVYVWELATRRELIRLDHHGLVWAIAFSPRGKEMASLGDGRLCIWDCSTWKQIKNIEQPVKVLEALAFSKDGKKLAFGTGDKQTGNLRMYVRIYDADKMTEINKLNVRSDHTKSAIFDSTGDRVATGGTDKAAR